MIPLSILLCIFILPVFGRDSSIVISQGYFPAPSAEYYQRQEAKKKAIQFEEYVKVYKKLAQAEQQDTEHTYTPPMTGGQSHSEFLVLELYNELLENCLTVDKLLPLYDQYKEACYNDSTYGYVGSELVVWGDIVKRKDLMGYIHKQPTFTGFMEFIGEKQE